MSAADNPGRAAILDRIRAALRNPAPEAAASPPSGEVIFEPVADPLERFQLEAKANLMECSVTADIQASAQQLSQVLDSLPPGEIFVEDHPSLRRLVELSKTSRPVRWSSEGAPREASQATVTRVEALVAQTGSLLVSASCGGRGASVVAPCHIAIAGTSQLVPDLAVALQNASQRGILETNSFACMISGSSRTADIEKILVQGAHGPRRLVVILQREELS
jgi:L-lactate dehydrogenase complex protein LldG